MNAVLGARSRGSVAFVGEGSSDRYGALYADLAFAKDRLVDMRARHYRPEWGRFLNPDPLGLASGSPNLYAFVAWRPSMGVDPRGLCSAWEIFTNQHDCRDYFVEGWNEGWEMRPTCQSWSTISPPSSCTPSVVSFQPSTCSSLHTPGAAGQPRPSRLIPVASVMISPAPARCR